MKVTNEDIISAAKTLRTRQESGLATPENPLKARSGKTGWIAAAACAAGFILGFGVHPLASNDGDAHLAELDSLRQEVLMARNAQKEVVSEVVRDTIFTTIGSVTKQFRIYKPEEKVIINNNNNRGESATVGCSMMCDNISYDLIASKN